MPAPPPYAIGHNSRWKWHPATWRDTCYKTRADASSRMTADQISDVALSLEYVKQYGEAHKELNYKQVYLLEPCVVWQRLSVHLGVQCDNVRASYDEIPKATQDEVFAGARTFARNLVAISMLLIILAVVIIYPTGAPNGKDVYKRQVQNLTRMSYAPPTWMPKEDNENGCIPVSYTHLDVYKRQSNSSF